MKKKNSTNVVYMRWLRYGGGALNGKKFYTLITAFILCMCIHNCIYVCIHTCGIVVYEYFCILRPEKCCTHSRTHAHTYTYVRTNRVRGKKYIFFLFEKFYPYPTNRASIIRHKVIGREFFYFRVYVCVYVYACACMPPYHYHNTPVYVVYNKISRVVLLSLLTKIFI